MVRQDRLELLADPEVSSDELISHRAVAAFIKEFLEVIRPSLQQSNEAIKREQAGIRPEGQYEGDPYMDLSPDLDDPTGVDNRTRGVVN